MNRRQFLAASASAPLLASASGSEPDWKVKLEEIRIRYELPAIGAAIVSKSGSKCVAVTGVRKRGTEVAATVDDLWHLGSNTKAMTSTLAAMVIEMGKLKWDTTVRDVFPKAKGLGSSALADATLTHLLSHWSGLPANPAWDEVNRGGRDVRSQREKVVAMALSEKNLPKPGEKHLYSNWGYAVAGHMLETILDQSWEDLMEKGVFSRLGIEQAGFGGTGTPGKIDQPWPHGQDGNPMPQNGPTVDNVPALGPAGTVHMSLSDWAKFIAEHLAGPLGEGKLLKQETYQHLHAAAQPGEPYAFGWLALERPWGGRVLTHNGSNTMNYCVTWLAPEKDFAMIACTNQGGDKCQKALDEVAGLLIGQGLRS